MYAPLQYRHGSLHSSIPAESFLSWRTRAMAGDDVWFKQEFGRFQLAPEKPLGDKLSRIIPMEAINADGPGLEDESWSWREEMRGERLGDDLIAYLGTSITVWLCPGKISSLSKDAKGILRSADLLISPMVGCSTPAAAGRTFQGLARVYQPRGADAAPSRSGRGLLKI